MPKLLRIDISVKLVRFIQAMAAPARGGTRRAIVRAAAICAFLPAAGAVLAAQVQDSAAPAASLDIAPGIAGQPLAAPVPASLSGHGNCASDAWDSVLPKWCRAHGQPGVHLAQADGALEIADITGPAGVAVPIKIKLPANVTRLTSGVNGPVLLMFRNVPPEVTLSSGFRAGDSWLVSINEVEKLALFSPSDFDATFKLQVTLRKGREGDTDRRIVSVTIGSGATASAAARPPVQPKFVSGNVGERVDVTGNVTPPRPANPTQINQQEEAALMERAGELLKQGDFEAARLIYSELAERGSSQAAFQLAQTFDPQVMKAYFVVGLKPDLEKARRWYMKAADLGDRKAAERLSALPQSK